jgi:hypothetical protein
MTTEDWARFSAGLWIESFCGLNRVCYTYLRFPPSTKTPMCLIWTAIQSLGNILPNSLPSLDLTVHERGQGRQRSMQLLHPLVGQKKGDVEFRQTLQEGKNLLTIPG